MSQRRRSLPLVFGMVLIDLVAFGIVLPLLPFFASDLGGSPAVVGLIIAAYSAMQFIFSPLWGRASDRFGRRPIMVICLLGTAAAYLVFALAESLLMLFLSRLLAGILGAAFVIARAYVADSTTSERRTRGMGMLGMAFGLGFIVGPALGAALSPWGYVLPGMVAAGLSLASAAVAWLFLAESAPGAGSRPPAAQPARPGVLVGRARELTRALARPELRHPILAAFLGTTGFAAFTATFPLFLRDPLGLTPAAAGVYFSLAGLMSAAVQGGAIGPLVDRFGERSVAAAGASLAGASVALVAVITGNWGLAILLGGVGGGWGLLNPSLAGLVSRATVDSMQGGVLGALQSASSLARVIGPLAGGWAFGALGYRWEFAIGGGLLLATAAFLSTRAVAPVAETSAS